MRLPRAPWVGVALGLSVLLLMGQWVRRAALTAHGPGTYGLCSIAF